MVCLYLSKKKKWFACYRGVAALRLNEVSMVRDNSKGGPMFLLHLFNFFFPLIFLVPCLVSLDLTILFNGQTCL
jgi:hypothetical protein